MTTESSKNQNFIRKHPSEGMDALEKESKLPLKGWEKEVARAKEYGLDAAKSIISGNSNHLENIIINILDNAVKYSKKNPHIIISSYNSDDNIIICIQDNGIGMDKNIQKLIFEKFYREQNGNIHDIKGHGLGLSYVKKIIDFHNGKIALESKKGVGTKFYITLKNI